MRTPQIQPMRVDLRGVGSGTSVENAPRDDGIEGRRMMENSKEGAGDGVRFGFGDVEVKLSGRGMFRCKNHWNGIFCPKWVSGDGTACGTCMVS